DHQQESVCEWHGDIHRVRRRGTPLPERSAGRHGRHQRADPGAGGVLLVRRLEELALRRPARARHRGGQVLYQDQGGDDALAALARPGTPLRVVAAMYSSPGMFIVRGDSPYRGIADLKGQPVVLGTQASGITALGKTVLESLEIKVQPIYLEKAADGPAMLID